MHYTDILTGDTPFAHHTLLLDKNEKIVPKVISYNNLTKETELYKLDNKGDLIPTETPGKYEIEKVILEGSRLVFRIKGTEGMEFKKIDS